MCVNVNVDNTDMSSNHYKLIHLKYHTEAILYVSSQPVFAKVPPQLEELLPSWIPVMLQMCSIEQDV